MSVVKKTLQENFIYFIKERTRVEDEIGKLPVGSISIKRIGNATYYYHQWREGRKVKAISLGKEEPAELIQDINRRRQLEKQRTEILDNLAVIAKALDTQRITADEIIRIFSRNEIRAVLIGSYCLPAMKEDLNLHVPTIKTQDIDFLVQTPYKGKQVDIESLLKPLGFSIGFNPDGSTFFTNGVFNVEFLTPEKGKGRDKAIAIRHLKIAATPLRYLQMLVDNIIEIKKDDYAFLIPSPWVFAFHKILISKYRKRDGKKEKDILQSIAILREVFQKPDMKSQSLSYLNKLPKKWKTYITNTIREHFSTINL